MEGVVIIKAVFYKTSSDERCVQKQLSSAYSTEITAKEEVNITEPTFFLAYNANLLSYNYMYVQELGRYYFIRDYKINTSATMDIVAEEDVLMSYAVYIKSVDAFIERQENKYNRYIVDTELLTRADKTQILNEVGQVGVDNVVRYYLVTTGGQ